MYIVIIGGSKIGYYLSKALLNQGHEVLIIEKDPHICERLEDELGSCCMRGDGCETVVLNEAGLNRADVLIATTGQDEDNLVSCQVAKHRYKVPRTISLINNPINENIFKKLGIDATVSVTNTILDHVEQEIPAHPLIHLLNVKDGVEEIVELVITKDSPALGKTLGQLRLSADTTIVLLLRENEKPRIPDTDTVLKENDCLIALTTPDSEKSLRRDLLG